MGITCPGGEGRGQTLDRRRGGDKLSARKVFAKGDATFYTENTKTPNSRVGGLHQGIITSEDHQKKGGGDLSWLKAAGALIEAHWGGYCAWGGKKGSRKGRRTLS